MYFDASFQLAILSMLSIEYAFFVLLMWFLCERCYRSVVIAQCDDINVHAHLLLQILNKYFWSIYQLNMMFTFIDMKLLKLIVSSKAGWRLYCNYSPNSPISTCDVNNCVQAYRRMLKIANELQLLAWFGNKKISRSIYFCLATSLNEVAITSTSNDN